MKIDGIQNKFVTMNSYKSKENMKTEEITNTNNNVVKIQISDSAKTLVNKINQPNNIGFSERVEKIRQAILDGSYKVSTEEIADRIIKTIEEKRSIDE